MITKTDIPQIILGIDPAPSKGNTIVEITVENGKVADIKSQDKLSQEQTKERLQNLLQSGKQALIAWDAPLTGPSSLDEPQEGEFYTRKLEKQIIEANPPDGISVQGYAGCPHWTLSQWHFGLPQMRQEHLLNGGFELITNDNDRSWKCGLVEVHPAVALWQWLKKEAPDPPKLFFCYKNKKKLKANELRTQREELLVRLMKCWEGLGIDLPKAIEEEAIKHDDVFDALIAAVLAYAWSVKKTDLLLVGNRKSGAWLLPETDDSKGWFKQCR